MSRLILTSNRTWFLTLPNLNECLSSFKRPFQLKVTDLANILNASNRNLYNSLNPPFPSFLWPIIVLIICGIAITSLFSAIKQNVAKAPFAIFKATA